MVRVLPYRFFEDQKKIDERLQRARKMTQENRLTELVRYDDYKGSLLLILVVPVPLLDPCSAVDLFIVDLFIADLFIQVRRGRHADGGAAAAAAEAALAGTVQIT